MKGIGEFVGKYGKQLVRSKAVEFKTVVNPEKLTVAVRRATDGTWFLFFHNCDRKLPFRENVVLKTVTGEVFHAYCSLDPSDSRVLVVKNDKSQGVWWPKEQAFTATSDQYARTDPDCPGGNTTGNLQRKMEKIVKRAFVTRIGSE